MITYISTYITIKQYTKSYTYVGLYGSGLFNFGFYVSLPALFACFLSFDVPTSSFIFIENVYFIILVSIVFFLLNGVNMFCTMQKYWCKLYIMKSYNHIFIKICSSMKVSLCLQHCLQS